ncbi:hypothetical protein BC939DRAFT_501186 [Gamsiella multidivaricata]|uniref:uncharacterized protein n=1 Tax=Gamsiella multidivaricata TaxID=101098 RepID=UPI0022203E79|nr:uncharacterized protein BC939DRAFT_501186 [Gamsiella multidivaricata]KAG0369190.1 hypothetical protein BGZ54_000121 [Gamsiella multidivaricata]KAI7827653.1 hypothetical protein BC939DRAFT_501186 [Gamsiella multidivaricata]
MSATSVIASKCLSISSISSVNSFRRISPATLVSMNPFRRSSGSISSLKDNFMGVLASSSPTSIVSNSSFRRSPTSNVSNFKDPINTFQSSFTTTTFTPSPFSKSSVSNSSVKDCFEAARITSLRKDAASNSASGSEPSSPLAPVEATPIQTEVTVDGKVDSDKADIEEQTLSVNSVAAMESTDTKASHARFVKEKSM